MAYSLQVRSYKRYFKKPLVTSQCTFDEREGLIIRLEDANGKVGFGEIAPMHFLGSESFSDAEIFCSQIPSEIDDNYIKSINTKFPSCQFGIQTAQQNLKQNPISRKFETAALCSLSETFNFSTDYKTFKFKIGILNFEEECDNFLFFKEKLPNNVKLRLDANGHLSFGQTKKWLEFLDGQSVEFLEQPLPKGFESSMIQLASDYSTSIALDESVINIRELQKVLDAGWSGWLIIKPSLMGDINRFRKLRDQCDNPIIYSSVFETAIGIEAGLSLAAEDSKNNYALGFGTIDYFSNDYFGFHERGPYLNSGKMMINDIEKIWALCKTIR